LGRAEQHLPHFNLQSAGISHKMLVNKIKMSPAIAEQKICLNAEHGGRL